MYYLSGLQFVRILAFGKGLEKDLEGEAGGLDYSWITEDIGDYIGPFGRYDSDNELSLFLIVDDIKPLDVPLLHGADVRP